MVEKVDVHLNALFLPSKYLFIYYEIVHEYTIKKKKEKVKLSSTQKINHAINVLAVEKRR